MSFEAETVISSECSEVASVRLIWLPLAFAQTPPEGLKKPLSVQASCWTGSGSCHGKEVFRKQYFLIPSKYSLDTALSWAINCLSDALRGENKTRCTENSYIHKELSPGRPLFLLRLSGLGNRNNQIEMITSDTSHFRGKPSVVFRQLSLSGLTHPTGILS